MADEKELTPAEKAKANLLAAQKRAQEAKAKADADKAARIKAVLQRTLKADKAFPLGAVIPHKDRDGRIVAAILLDVVDAPKKDSSGHAVMNDGKVVFEASARVFIFSKIDVPHEGAWVEPSAAELAELEGGK